MDAIESLTQKKHLFGYGKLRRGKGFTITGQNSNCSRERALIQ
jgi:hypothetical protein